MKKGLIQELSQKDRIWIIVCLLAALLSFSVMSRVATSPKVLSATMDSLDRKRQTVGEISAAAAVTSVLIAAVPEDATTPIADQISNVCSYLLIVVGAIMLEKCLLSIMGILAFKVLIPVGCLICIIYLLSKKQAFLKLGIRLFIFGMVFYALIPASVAVGNSIDKALHTSESVEDVKNIAEEIEEYSNDTDTNEKKSILDRLTEFGSSVIEKFTGILDYFEQVVDRFLDAVAALIVTTCLIPLIVVWIFIQFAKYLVGLSRAIV